MKAHLALLALFALSASQFVDPTCPAGGNFSQTIFFNEWGKLRIQLLLKGQIEVVMGDNGTLPTLEVISNGPSQAEAEAVMIGITNDNGNLTVLIGVDLPPPPVPPVSPFDPEDEPVDPSTSGAIRASPWKTVAAGMAAALGTQFMYSESRWGAASMAAMVPLALSVDAQGTANTTCIGARVILTLPPAIADYVSAEVGQVFNTAVDGKIEYTVGQLNPAQAGYGTCTVDGTLGECVDTATCTKNKVAGQCPGPANIQCCVDNYGGCCANGKRGSCTSTCNGGTRTAGLCPGSAQVQCCTTSSSPSCGAGGSYTAPKARTSGVTFAPPTASHWPLRQPNPSSRAPVCYIDTAGVARQSPTSPIASGYDCSVRRFLAGRSGGARYHSGIDLYAPAGTDVVATEAGRIVNTYPFFENVCCVIQQTDSGIVINYGEISCNYVVRNGQRVTAGQKIGTVGNLDCCHPMLHFETYVQGTTSNKASYPNSIHPALRNPTDYLLTLRENGL